MLAADVCSIFCFKCYSHAMNHLIAEPVIICDELFLYREISVLSCIKTWHSNFLQLDTKSESGLKFL
jgi:hypothetical protein